jgi:hypothetical protein
MKEHGAWVTPAVCPECHYKMDASSSLGDETGHGPEPGTVTLCMKCGEICLFTECMALRKATVYDFLNWPAKEMLQIKKAQAAIRFLRAAKAGKVAKERA